MIFPPGIARFHLNYGYVFNLNVSNLKEIFSVGPSRAVGEGDF
jgi:hypothetical protein